MHEFFEAIETHSVTAIFIFIALWILIDALKAKS